MNLELRPATLADLNDIMALEAAGFAACHQECREVYLRRISVFPAGALIAEQDARVVGCFFSEIWGACAAPPDADHFRLGHDIRDRHDAENGTTLYVSSMTLAPALRGQRLGEPFFAGCIDHVTTRFPRLDNVLLLVNESWERALSIYASVRFRELARLPWFFSSPGLPAEDGIVMRRAIPAR